MPDDKVIRDHVLKLLKGRQGHVDFETVLAIRHCFNPPLFQNGWSWSG